MLRDKRWWRKTAYATSQAMNTEEGIDRLMSRYKITDYSIINAKGTNGRPAFGVQFIIKDLSYLIHFESLEVRDVKPEDLVRQIKRLVFFTLKTSLERISCFEEPEKVFMPFLEIPGHGTLYEATKPHLSKIQKEGTGLLQLKNEAVAT